MGNNIEFEMLNENQLLGIDGGFIWKQFLIGLTGIGASVIACAVGVIATPVVATAACIYGGVVLASAGITVTTAAIANVDL